MKSIIDHHNHTVLVPVGSIIAIIINNTFTVASSIKEVKNQYNTQSLLPGTQFVFKHKSKISVVVSRTVRSVVN